MKKLFPVFLAHSLSSLGTALFLNASIAIAAGNKNMLFLAGVQFVIILPSLFFSSWAGRFSQVFSTRSVILGADIFGLIAMTLVALAILKFSLGVTLFLLIGAAVCSVIDFSQSVSKMAHAGIRFTESEQARFVGLLQFTQALNLLIAPFLMSLWVNRYPLWIWPMINGISYVISWLLLFLFGKPFWRQMSELIQKNFFSERRDYSVPITKTKTLFALSGILGACAIVVPILGADVLGGASGAMIAGFMFAVGVAVSGLGAEFFWKKFGDSLTSKLLLVAMVGLILLICFPTNHWVVLVCALLMGTIAPVLEVFLVRLAKKFGTPEQSGVFIAKLSGRSRIAMSMGIILTSVLFEAFGLSAVLIGLAGCSGVVCFLKMKA